MSVGPRAHQDWVRDVAAVMRRATDPRSWRWLDVDEGEEERLEEPSFPFVLPPSVPQGAAAWRRGLRTVPRTSVERLLVMLSTTWLDVPRERARNDFETRRPELERKARAAPWLSGGRLSTRTPGTRDRGVDSNPRPGLLLEATTGCTPLSQYDWDLGLIAVSGTELGLFVLRRHLKPRKILGCTVTRDAESLRAGGTA